MSARGREGGREGGREKAREGGRQGGAYPSRGPIKFSEAAQSHYSHILATPTHQFDSPDPTSSDFLVCPETFTSHRANCRSGTASRTQNNLKKCCKNTLSTKEKKRKNEEDKMKREIFYSTVQI